MYNAGDIELHIQCYLLIARKKIT